MSLSAVLEKYGLELPKPLPSNRDTWRAFQIVAGYRHAPMGTLWRPHWTDIRTVLKLYGLWTQATHQGLELCFSQLLELEAEEKAEGGN